MTEEPKGGNGAPEFEVVPPLSDKEFAELKAQFEKRGLPVILYVFTGSDMVSASRLIHGAKSRQMAAVATELDEWARTMTRAEFTSMQQRGPAVAKPSIIIPR